VKNSSSVDSNSIAKPYEHFPAVNTDAVITVSASSDEFWAIDEIEWSYDTLPENGVLTVAYGGSTLKKYHITKSGPEKIQYAKPFYNEGKPKNEELVITLSAGGPGASGTVMARIR